MCYIRLDCKKGQMYWMNVSYSEFVEAFGYIAVWPLDLSTTCLDYIRIVSCLCPTFLSMKISHTARNGTYHLSWNVLPMTHKIWKHYLICKEICFLLTIQIFAVKLIFERSFYFIVHIPLIAINIIHDVSLTLNFCTILVATARILTFVV